jgi:hypothetical protein
MPSPPNLARSHGPGSTLRGVQDGVVGRLLLWDIDGTLIRGGGVGSAAINEAAAVVLGKPIVGPPVVMHGNTDPQILTELFLAAEVTEDAIVELLPVAVAEAERRLALSEADLRRRGGVIDGVVDRSRSSASRCFAASATSRRRSG